MTGNIKFIYVFMLFIKNELSQMNIWIEFQIKARKILDRYILAIRKIVELWHFQKSRCLDEKTMVFSIIYYKV